MKRLIPIVFAVLFAGNLFAGPSGGGVSLSYLRSGDTVNGALAPTDARGSRGYEDTYSFETAAGMPVVITATFQGFDGYLFLNGPGGNVAYDDDWNSTADARIEWITNASGVYTIVVTSFSAGATGNYSLNLVIGNGQTTIVPVTPNSLSLASGQTVTGTLQSGDTVGARGFQDSYSFQAATGQTIDIQAAFNNFDGYLFLRSPSGREESNDDYNDTRHSRIATRAQENGLYTVIVSTYSSGSTGDYAMSLNGAMPVVGSAPQPSGTLAIASGQTVTGTLQSGDGVGSRGFEDRYSFQAASGQSIVIQSVTDAFDGYLYLRSPSGREESNDDYNDTRHSRIATTAQESGWYTIIVCAYSNGSTGAYALSLNGAMPSLTPAGSGVALPIYSGQTVTGTLQQGDTAGTRGYRDAYTFQASVGQGILVQAAFDNIDGYLYLLSPSGREESNDDYQDTRHSRIQTTAQENGTYTILVSTYSTAYTGAYAMSLNGSMPSIGGTSVVPVTPPILMNGGTVAFGQAVTGGLEQGDATGSRGYQDTYVYNAPYNNSFDVNVAFNGFDGYLIVRSPSGREVANDDDTDVYHSWIQILGSESGPYTIIVTSYRNGTTGSYTLNIAPPRAQQSGGYPPLDYGGNLPYPDGGGM